jgi:hypothetical protein
MIKASAYILKVPPNRRGVLLDHTEEGRYFKGAAPAEPVPRFDHSRRAPLVVFAAFEDNVITHVADGRKGTSGGTGLVRLNLEDLRALTHPVSFESLIASIPGKFRGPLRRRLDDGGVLPQKTLGAVVDALTQLDPTLAAGLTRFSARRVHALARLTSAQRGNLAVQKETLSMALEIAGLPKEEALAWSPPDATPRSFLDGMPQIRAREDAMLLADFDNIPGFKAITSATHYAAKTFEDDHENRSIKLTVIMANRLPLEEQTGADLIYFNETYRAFVMVQYKAMEERGDDGPEFRWQDGDQLSEELTRMDALLDALSKVPFDNDPDGYRLNNNPFFLKFCSRMVFNPDDQGLFPGLYLPLDLWTSLNASGRLKGPRAGNRLSYANVGRRLSNTQFAGLVANSWVGTTIGQSTVLERVIREVLATGKTVTFAVNQHVPSPEVSAPGGAISLFAPTRQPDRSQDDE